MQKNERNDRIEFYTVGARIKLRQRLQRFRERARKLNPQPVGDPEDIRRDSLETFEASRPLRDRANKTIR